MKALGKNAAGPGIVMLDWPEPECGPNDVIIRIRKTAICGTDLHIRQWDEWAARTIPIPMPIGHEFYGVVEALGREVRGLSIGQRVSGEGHITCGHCRNCRAGRRHLCRNTLGVGVNRPGAFAERIALPAANVFPVPDGIPDEIACILDPLGNAVHTALSFDLVGEDVLITGAGPIGIMAAAVAKHAGARNVVITDVNAYRLALAAAMGAHAVQAGPGCLDEAMAELRMVEGFDVGMEMSGNGTAFRDMIGHMNHGGKIAMLGILPSDLAVDWGKVIFKGLVLKGVYGREMYETWYKMTSMLTSGLEVTPVITHHYPVGEFEAAFGTAGSGQAGKVLLSWEA